MLNQIYFQNLYLSNETNSITRRFGIIDSKHITGANRFNTNGYRTCAGAGNRIIQRIVGR